MQIFGITLNRYSIPIIYLACAIVEFLLIRESIHMFQHPIATRAISVWLGVGFIALSLPAIYTSKIALPKQASVLLIIWLVWTLLSTLLGEQPWPAMVRWFEILTSVLMGLCLYFIINKQPNLINLLLKAIVAAVLLCLLAFVVYWNLLGDPIKHNWVSDIPFFVNIRHFGQLIAVAVPVGYLLLEKASSEHKKTYWIIGYLIFSWALVFWLGGRGTFLAVSITTILHLFINKQHKKWLVLAPIAGLVISLFFIVDHPSLNLLRHFGDKGVSLNAMSSSRLEIFIESILHWWNAAPIMGIGADGFFYIIPAIGIDSMAHPHSSIIQLLLAFGPIGLLIPSYFFYALTQQVIKANHSSQFFYLILLSTLILSLFDGILYHAYGLFISSIVAGMCIARAWPQPIRGSNLSSDNTNNGTSENTANITTDNNSNNKSLATCLVISVLASALYCGVFNHQLYYSKHGIKTEQWINWNARYPLYFSPTWTYERYSAKDIERLRQEYIERIPSNR